MQKLPYRKFECRAREVKGKGQFWIALLVHSFVSQESSSTQQALGKLDVLHLLCKSAGVHIGNGGGGCWNSWVKISVHCREWEGRKGRRVKVYLNTLNLWWEEARTDKSGMRNSRWSSCSNLAVNIMNFKNSSNWEQVLKSTMLINVVWVCSCKGQY